MGLGRMLKDLVTASSRGNDPAKIWSKWDGVQGMPASDRKARGIGGRLTVTSIDKKNFIGYYVGSDGKTRYRTTLLRCSCPDFQKRNAPCKHMYNLAWSCGLDIHLDYAEMMQKSLDFTAPECEESQQLDFYAYRNTFEMMLSNKIVQLIRNAGGRMSQVDIKNELQGAELKYFDYAIYLLSDSGRIVKEKEKSRVFFSVT